ncbi:hypothetical protein RHOFW510R12_03935 [Rhodanobacter sp. FW510-R12]
MRSAHCLDTLVVHQLLDLCFDASQSHHSVQLLKFFVEQALSRRLTAPILLYFGQLSILGLRCLGLDLVIH